MIAGKTAENQSKAKSEGLGGAADLPCLYSNNCTETIELKYILGASEDSKTGLLTTKYIDPDTGEILVHVGKGSNKLSSSQKKSSRSLAWNVQYMATKHGINNLAFVTLTFADNVTFMGEAQRRYKSLSNHFIKNHFLGAICVKERTKKGRIHFHLVVALNEDIRTGFDFDAAEKGDYSSAGKRIKKEWSLLRFAAKRYGFGRTELLPVKSTAEGISRYVGKYISKNIQQRPDEDKGTRLVNYSGDSRVANTRYSSAGNIKSDGEYEINKGGRNWRHKCNLFAEKMSDYYNYKITQDNIAEVLGKRWAYKYRDNILSFPDYDDELANKCYQEIRTNKGKKMTIDEQKALVCKIKSNSIKKTRST